MISCQRMYKVKKTVGSLASFSARYCATMWRQVNRSFVVIVEKRNLKYLLTFMLENVGLNVGLQMINACRRYCLFTLLAGILEEPEPSTYKLDMRFVQRAVKVS